MIDLINVMAKELCGSTASTSIIPPVVFNLTHLVILAIQVVVPILLIIWGMMDFTKAVVGGNEDKIKEAQKVFIKRLVAAIIVFLTVTIVNLVVNLVADITSNSTEGGDVDNSKISTCLKKFVGGASK